MRYQLSATLRVMNREEINRISKIIIATAVAIHRRVGCGLREDVYVALLAEGLEEEGLNVKREAKVPFSFGKLSFKKGF